MIVQERTTVSWLWYATETDRCIPLDRQAYPSTMFAEQSYPFPEWACRSPNGGLHVNAHLDRIDLEIARAPDTQNEFTWSCEYTIFILSYDWLEEIEDLLRGSQIEPGNLLFKGQTLPRWRTLRSRRPPSLVAKEGYRAICPICGYSCSIIYEGECFSDHSALNAPVIVNDSGIFVREDIAIGRNLRTPRGAFEPSPVTFEPPPPKFRTTYLE